MRLARLALLVLGVCRAGSAGAAPSPYRFLTAEQFERRMSQKTDKVHPAALTRARALGDLRAFERAVRDIWRGRWDGSSGRVDVSGLADKAAAELPAGAVPLEAFADIVRRAAAALGDSHLYVMEAGDELGNISEPASPLRWRKLSEDIGLIQVDRFPEPGQPFGDKFPAMVDEALRGLRNTQGLILDLRGNAGGDPNQADRFYDYFASTTVFLYSEVVRKSGAMAAYLGPDVLARWRFGKDGFSEPFPFEYEPADPGFKYRGRVLVLTDAGTVSAAEYFESALLDNGWAESAGARTLGHDGSIVPVELPASRLVLALPIQHVLRRDGSALQDRGIAPRYPLDPASPDILLQAERILRDKPRH